MLPPLSELPGQCPKTPKRRRQGQPALWVVLRRPVEALAKTDAECADASRGLGVRRAQELLLGGRGQAQHLLDAGGGEGHSP